MCNLFITFVHKKQSHHFLLPGRQPPLFRDHWEIHPFGRNSIQNKQVLRDLIPNLRCVVHQENPPDSIPALAALIDINKSGLRFTVFIRLALTDETFIEEFLPAAAEGRKRGDRLDTPRGRQGCLGKNLPCLVIIRKLFVR